MNVDAEKDEAFKNALDNVLGFYGTQLQSHAATLISLSVAIFAVFSLKPTGIIGTLGLALTVPLLIMISGYTLLRLVVYGGLSRTILYGDFHTASQVANFHQEWKTALPQTKVSIYTHSCFNETWRDRKRFGLFKGSYILTKNDQPNRYLLFMVWAISLIVTVVFSLLS